MRSPYFRILALALVLSLIGCSSPESIKAKRYAKAKANAGDIVIGVTWPGSQLVSDFRSGVGMALEEVNKKGLYNNRKLRLIWRDNQGDPEYSKAVDREFAENTDLVAVIGHFYSDLALNTSVTAERYGFLFLTPGSLLYELGLHKFGTFFRTIPNTLLIGQKCADYTYKLGCKKPVVVWVRSRYGKSLNTIYVSQLAKYGINVVASYSFFPWDPPEYRKITSQLKNLDFDMIFMAVALPDVAWFMRDARAEGINQPFLGVNLLADRLVKELGKDVHNIYTVANYNPNNNSPISKDFTARFKAKYGHEPDVWGAQGYDSINMLAELLRKHQTSHPQDLALNLRYLENWEGVTGVHSFSDRGEVITKPLYLEKFQDGQLNILDVDTLRETDLYSTFNYTLRSQIERGYLGLYDDAGVLTILLPDNSLFSGLGDHAITALGDTLLSAFAKELKVQTDFYIDVESFSASADLQNHVGSAVDDSLLSNNLRKSAKIAQYLFYKGLERSRIRVTGHAFTKATAASKQFSTRLSFNNRVELTLVPTELWFHGRSKGKSAPAAKIQE